MATESELAAQIASNVVSIVSTSQPTVTGDLSVIDYTVVVTIDAAGTTRETTQRVHVLNRGTGSESATLANKPVVNYAAPPLMSNPEAWLLANESAFLASITGAAKVRLGPLTGTGKLPIQILNSAGSVIDENGTLAADQSLMYLVIPTSDSTWILREWMG